MNYRHSYHAGNFADLFKHLILTLLVECLNRKNTGCSYLDTHAGRGLYKVAYDGSLKTHEADSGIRMIWPYLTAVPDACANYRRVLQHYNPNGKLSIYPGSITIVKNLARPQDRIIGIELQPQEQRILKQFFRCDAQVAIHLRDGYSALKAFLPPKPARGLVLIDPPFENADEFSMLYDAMNIAISRWSSGCYAIWYPIKNFLAIERWINKMRKISNHLLRVELNLTDQVDSNSPLTATGMLIFNPPWQIENFINEGVAWLWSELSPLQRGGFTVERF